MSDPVDPPPEAAASPVPVISLPTKAVTIPLSPDLRQAYKDLLATIQQQIDSTMDAVALEALNPVWAQVDEVLTQDGEYSLGKDTIALSTVQEQVASTNQQLDTLKKQIAATAAHFATAGEVVAAIDKIFKLIEAA